MKKLSTHIETATQMVVGFVINYFLTMLIFGTTLTKTLGASCIFFTCSYIRSYMIRTWFEKRNKGEVK